MRIALNVLGGIALLVGAVWVLQGLNVLTGSYMSGQDRWLVIGSLCALAGLAMVVLANVARR